MSSDTFRAVLVVLIAVFGTAFLAIVADIMGRHPSTLWYVFGFISAIALEAFIYGIYYLVKNIRGR